MKRAQLTDTLLLETVETLIHNIAKRLEKHGYGAFDNTHEALGILTEEFWEVTDATRTTDLVKIAEEYFDVAVTCIVAVASMMASGEEVEETNENSQADGLSDINLQSVSTN